MRSDERGSDDTCIVMMLLFITAIISTTQHHLENVVEAAIGIANAIGVMVDADWDVNLDAELIDRVEGGVVDALHLRRRCGWGLFIVMH